MTSESLVPPIIDTHTHLDDPAFLTDLDAVVTASRSVGVRHFVNIGYSPESWESSRRLRDRYSEVSMALGLHPQQADRFSPEILRNLSRTIQDDRAIAVGEIGFDFARPQPGFNEQERAFRAQLEIAATLGIPAIIHQRDAASELMAELDRWPTLAPIVLHSFDGTQLLAEWAVERGCYIGVGGLATRRRSSMLQEALSRIPIDRLLLETDAPYLPPPGVSDRRNTPANLPRIANILSPLWDLTQEDLCRVTCANAVSLFGLPEIDRSNTTEEDDKSLQSEIAHGHVKSGENSRVESSSAT